MMSTESRASRTQAAALVAAAVLACAAPRDAEASSVQFKPADASCRRATPAQLAWLPGDAWKPYAAAVRVCSVGRHARAAPALLVASVWEDDYYATLPSGTTTVQMPHAQLLAPDGRPLGELPMNFPVDEAATLKLGFANWRGRLPAEIHLCVLSPGVAGNYILPALRLDAAGKHYDAPAGQPSAPTKKDNCHGPMKTPSPS